MATISKLKLSGSTSGKGIKIAQTATPGTTIHTCSSSSSVIDELWLYAMNTGGITYKLTIEWGGVASPDDIIELGVPGESGLVLVIPGLILEGAATPPLVRGFAEQANLISVYGYVNRIS